MPRKPFPPYLTHYPRRRNRVLPLLGSLLALAGCAGLFVLMTH